MHRVWLGKDEGKGGIGELCMPLVYGIPNPHPNPHPNRHPKNLSAVFIVGRD